MIYLDNAATTFPKPACVICAVSDFMKSAAANPGRGSHALSIRASYALFESRALLAEFFHTDVSRVAFTMNCTQAINFALKGCLQKGDHVIISSLEHNAVYRPLFRMQQDGFVTFDVAEVDPNDDGRTVRNFEKLIRETTKMIFCTHVSNVFGTELPIASLARLAHKHGLVFGVDAAQSAGCYRLNMEDMGIDLVCVPGHKGLFGPMGTGVLLFGDQVSPAPILEGGTGSLSLQAEQPEEYPDRLESGTLNLPGIVGLAAGLRFLRSIGGVDAVHEREAELIRVLKSDLHAIRGVKVYDRVQKDNATLLSFNIGRLQSEEAARQLSGFGFAVRAGYHCAALAHRSMNTTDPGTIRVSPGVFSTKQQMKNFIFYVNQIALGKKVC